MVNIIETLEYINGKHSIYKLLRLHFFDFTRQRTEPSKSEWEKEEQRAPSFLNEARILKLDTEVRNAKNKEIEKWDRP